MQSPIPYPIEGGCDCKSVRYQLTSAPLVVHCCQLAFAEYYDCKAVWSQGGLTGICNEHPHADVNRRCETQLHTAQ
jgi:hypothetical protein